MKREELARLLRASYYFLQREQARRAWFIFAVCVAFASLPWTARWDGLRQGAIVMASLAAAAIFMPELNSRLWHLSANEIRDMIPEHKRRAFYAELIRADCPDEEWAQQWADLVWRQGVMPLLDAAHDTRRIHWDVTYEVSVHLGYELEIGGRELPMARVETLHDYRCLLPAAEKGSFWVSIAGNEVSLLSEFGENGCLSRELVRLPRLSKENWAEEVRRLCEVSVRIGGDLVPFDEDSIVTVPGHDGLRIVRWLVPAMHEEADGAPASCLIEIDFPTKMRENNFPLLLAGYYCAGKTTLSFKVYHGRRERPILRYYGDFLSEGGSNVATWKPERHDTAERQSVIYRSPQSNLLWPGSGIYCWWESE